MNLDIIASKRDFFVKKIGTKTANANAEVVIYKFSLQITNLRIAVICYIQTALTQERKITLHWKEAQNTQCIFL